MPIKKPDSYLWKPSAMLNSPRVEDLSALEELWYRRALDRSFDDEGISADPAKAAKRIGRKCTVQAAEKILEIFFVPKPRDPSKMINLRQEIERKNAIKSLKKFSDAGKESGRKRRERKKLDAEHRLNDVATINKLINKDLKEPPIVPQNPNQRQGEKPPAAELIVWLDNVAGIVGAKSRKSLPNLSRWSEVCSIAIREDRDMLQFLDAVKAERDRCGADIQFFTPEGVLKRAQMSPAKNGHKAKTEKPDWQLAIENCELCDERGYTLDELKLVCSHGGKTT